MCSGILVIWFVRYIVCLGPNVVPYNIYRAYGNLVTCLVRCVVCAAVCVVLIQIPVYHYNLHVDLYPLSKLSSTSLCLYDRYFFLL